MLDLYRLINNENHIIVAILSLFNLNKGDLNFNINYTLT